MSAEAKQYLSKHQIPQVVESMASMLIKDAPEKPLDAMAAWLATQGGVGTDVYNLRTKARVTSLAPTAVQGEAGKTYYWCSCGHSKSMPFCDGTHTAVNEKHGSKLTPVPYSAAESKTVYLCGCRNTKNPPMCDGSHTKLHAVKLYVFEVSPNAMAVLAFVRDANIPCEVTSLTPGDHKKEDYLKTFPMGQVPALTDPGAGPGGVDFHTFESCSILRYLCHRYRLGAPWYPVDPVGRNRVDRMLDWRQTAMYPPLAKMCYPFLGLMEKNDAEIEKGKKDFTTAAQVFTDKLLEGKTFVGGDQPCIADYAIAVSLCIVPAAKAAGYEPSPALLAYFHAVQGASLYFNEVTATMRSMAKKE